MESGIKKPRSFFGRSWKMTPTSMSTMFATRKPLWDRSRTSTSIKESDISPAPSSSVTRLTSGSTWADSGASSLKTSIFHPSVMSSPKRMSMKNLWCKSSSTHRASGSANQSTALMQKVSKSLMGRQKSQIELALLTLTSSATTLTIHTWSMGTNTISECLLSLLASIPSRYISTRTA